MVYSDLGRGAKLLLVFSTLCFFMFGAAIVSVGLYNLVDHGFLSEIIGSRVYEVAAYVLVLVGAMIIFISFMGCWGTAQEHRCCLITFIVILIMMFLGALAGGVMSVVFRDDLSSHAKTFMSKSLVNYYGRFEMITEAWNATQDKLRCCAVDDEGWQLYRDSYWDRLTNADVRDRNRKLATWNPFYKFVPESCCLKLMDPLLKWVPSRDFRNVARCQHWQFGPPTHNNGAWNDAIYYQGCFNAGKKFIEEHAKFLAGLGIALAVLLIAGIVLAIIVVNDLKSPKQRMAQRRYDQADQ